MNLFTKFHKVNVEVIKLMLDPISVRKSLENESLDKIIKERDAIIREIMRFEKNKIPQEDYLIDPHPKTIYTCKFLYLAEICNLIYEKMLNRDEEELSLLDIAIF